MALSDLQTFLNDGLASADIAEACILTTQETSGPPQAPVIVDVDHSCSGWRDTYSAADRIDGTVLVTDTKIYLLASSLDVTPEVGNSITIDSATYDIINLALDPAGVAYVCQCRV